MLVALTLSLVEGVWAATCMPVNSMNESVATAGALMPGMHADHDCTPASEGPESRQDEHDSPCPFNPAGMNQGCAASASLPARHEPVSAPSPETVVRVQTGETSPDLLGTAAIFHPPKS